MTALLAPVDLPAEDHPPLRVTANIFPVQNKNGSTHYRSGVLTLERWPEADLSALPPQKDLIDDIGPGYCLRNGLVPWRRIGNAVVIATSRPEEFSARRQDFPAGFGDILMAVAPEQLIWNAILSQLDHDMVRSAETRLDEAASCRTYRPRLAAVWLLASIGVLVLMLFLAPAGLFASLSLAGLVVLAVNTSLKVAAALAVYFGRRTGRAEWAVPVAPEETLVLRQPWEVLQIFALPTLLVRCVSWMMDPEVLPWPEVSPPCWLTIHKCASCTR